MESRKAGQDYWFDHIAQWRTSELTRTAYCTRHGLKFYTFAYWIKRHNAQGKPLRLVLAKIVEPATPQGLLLQGPQGWTLSVPASVSGTWLAGLLKALS